jgi:hypothetical protein
VRVIRQAYNCVAPYGTYPDGTAGFEETINKTGEYMIMVHKCCYFHYTGNDPEDLAENEPRLQAFRRILAGG